MQKKRMFILVGIGATIVIASLAVFSLLHARSLPLTPKARTGLIDLSSWDFTSLGRVRLDGAWSFARAEDGPWLEATVPDSWDRASGGMAPMDGPYGLGRYRLKILLPPSHSGLALCIPDQAISYELFVDGVALGGNGDLESEKDGYLIKRETELFPLDADRDSVLLELAVSNHQYDIGGIINPIYIGVARSLSEGKELETLRDGFLIGVLFVTALYHLSLYLFRRSDRSNLDFFIFCLLMGIRAFCVAHYPERIFPGRLVFSLSTRVEYLGFFFGVVAYMQFVRDLFPGLLDRRIPLVYALAATMGGLVVVGTPVAFFMAKTTKPFQGAVLIAGLFTFATFARALASGKRDSLVAFLGFSLFFLFLVNDILYSALVIHTAHLTSVGVLVFIASQSVTVAIRFNESYCNEMRLSRELEDERDRLEARVVERTTELAEANGRLAEVDRARKAFLSNTSHELRTPVSLIATPLEAIIAGRYGESVHRTAPVLSIIKRSADRLLRLADGLLEFLRLDSGAVIPRPVVLDLTDFAAPYMEEFALLCEKRDIGIAFDKGRGVVARVDPALLETAYLNLLSNAAKFTQPGGSIQVRTGKTEGRVWIEVADTGPGIPPEWLPRLFERYAAASESLRSSYSGFGIALPLAADIVRLLGGEIEVESTRGVGSEFRMSFPKSSGVPQPMAKLSSNRLAALVPATAIEAPEPDRDRAGSELPTVLVVDDDRDMTAFLVSFLSDRFAVFTAGSGDEALSFLGSGKRPRAIVADLMMPGMSGLELRRKVAAIDHLAGVPFLFLSAKSDEATRIAGLEAGAVDYLGKPFAVEELEARIASVISVGDAERARLERRVIAALRDDDRGTEVRADDWRAASKAIGLEGRDMEIAELVAAGKGDKEIAVALGYSARTVSNRVSAILKRTGSINRTALVARLHQSPRRA